MAEIINLRRARKSKARSEKEQTAESNRQKFGRTRAEKDLEKLERALREKDLDGKKRDR